MLVKQMVEDLDTPAQLKVPAEFTLLKRLRHETREVHEALENQLALTNPQLTLEQYRETLERFYAFYRPFETDVMPRLTPEWSALFEDRRKLPALISDLEFVGSINSHLFVCPDFPDYSNLLQILGALYVIEGSTLGGQMIARHVREVLGLSENEGLQFFSSYGAEVGPKWKTFRELLQRFSSPDRDPEIIESAKLTFQTLRRCLLESH